MSASLLRAELHRFRSRRFIVGLVLLALGVFLAGVTIASFQFEKASAAGLAEARQRAQQVVDEQNGYRQQCLASPPPGETAESACPSVLTVEELGLEQFVDKRPFAFGRDTTDIAPGIAGATAALLFVVGATWIGAEWSTRSIVALLFWEPRRVRVITTKLAVLVAAAAAVAVTAQLLWLAAARVLAGTRGTTDTPEGFAGDLLGIGARGVALGVLVAALGFSIAGLVRNTGAALGVAFVYFVVVENAVRILRPGWDDLLVSTNAAALLSEGGYRTYQDGQYLDERGVLQPGREVVLSNLHGATVLGLVVVAMVALGIVLFSRRDLH